jgi:DNA-binding NtrC family response regulator
MAGELMSGQLFGHVAGAFTGAIAIDFASISWLYDAGS